MLDALSKSRIRFITSRHEQVSAHSADGYARVTGKPGVVLSHLGPGLTNCATGVANAALDSIPMVVIAGDIPSYYYGRHPHQEVNLHQDADQSQIYRPFCKRVYRVDRAADLPRDHRARVPPGRPTAGRARCWSTSRWTSSPPTCRSTPSSRCPPRSPAPRSIPRRPSGSSQMLAEADRPLIYAGGGVLSARATSELAALAEALEVPVAHSLMGKGCLHEDHPLLLGMTGFWGTPVANDMCRTADVILAVGTRLAEASSSSWDPRFTFAAPPTRLIHIDADLAEIGRNLPTELGVIADARLALGRPCRGRARAPRTAIAAASATRFAAAGAPSPRNGRISGRPTSSRCGPSASSASSARRCPKTASSSPTSAGTRTASRSSSRSPCPGTFITPSGLATMGFGAAAVLGVKSGQPERAAVALVGDGGFGANPNVVATAMEAGLNVVWLIMDNAAFGTIAGLEQMHYGTTFGCVFERNGQPYRVDFAAMARAWGAHGVMVRVGRRARARRCARR